jgi:muramoyltetrapeptide carboxypeptidase
MANAKQISVGLIAPSSPVPPVEFAFGIDRIREMGWKVFVHPQTKKSHWFFAGRDEERAQAFFDYAHDPRFQILWFSRGGYGAVRLLPLLDELTKKHGVPPRKLLVGYSDATAFLEYVRVKWGWSVLHGPMPGLRKFCKITSEEWKALTGLIAGEAVKNPFGVSKLKFVGTKPSRAVRGELVGGNLCVLASMVGTKYQPDFRGKIVFFEEVDESLYRIDRMIHQLLMSGALKGARAIVLGNFLNCRDAVSKALVVKPKNAREFARMLESPKDSELGPIRKRLDEKKMISQLFAQIGNELGIPVAQGLPVGHGPGHFPLPMGCEYSLEPSGAFGFKSWEGCR